MLGQLSKRIVRWRMTVRWTSPTSSLNFNASENDMKAAVLIITLVLATILIASAIWLYTPDKSRSLLEARYLKSPTDYIEVEGLRMHVRDSGSKEAPAIVMLHGFGSSLHTWEPWSQALTATHRVIRFDLPGSALTGPDPTGDYTDARSLQVLAALMDRLDVKR